MKKHNHVIETTLYRVRLSAQCLAKNFPRVRSFSTVDVTFVNILEL